jgi:hypothetical protein
VFICVFLSGDDALTLWRGGGLPVKLLLVLLLFAASAWGQEPAGSTPDLLVVPTPIVGVALDRVRVWALHDGEWQAIPFQFDRRTADGDWDFALHASPEAAHRRLTDRDELVVARADLGETSPPGMVPPGAPKPISFGVPGGGRAYVAIHDAPPTTSPRRWITYDRESDAVVGPGYRLGFDSRRPFVFNELVWSADPAHEDWIDTGKIRARGRLIGRFSFVRTQDDFTSRITGVIDGPVRTIVRTENRVNVVLGLQSPRGIIDRIHTPEHFVMEILVQLPFNVGWLFQDLAVRSSLDLRPGAGLTVVCPGLPAATVDGRPTPGEEALMGCPMEGFTIVGPYGAVHGTLRLGPGFDLRPELFYVDDALDPDPPESDPGHYGETGVTLTGWEGLGRGDYRMRLDLSFAATGAGVSR